MMMQPEPGGRSATSRKTATPVAYAVEIYCPQCEREDPIPEPKSGSFLWDSLPALVTCPDCGGVSRVSKRIVV